MQLELADEWNRVWWKLIYGDLWDSLAVKVLEDDHPTPGLIKKKHFPIIEPGHPLPLPSPYPSKVERRAFGQFPFEVEMALCRKDWKFFSDLSEAIKRKEEPGKFNHKKIMEYYSKKFWILHTPDKIIVSIRELELPTIKELNKIQSGNASVIVEELQLRELGLIRKEKPGRKTAN